MLEVVPTLRSPSNKAAAAADQHHGVGFTADDYGDDFMVVDDDHNLLMLDYIDFTSCDVVPSLFDADGDILPDLEAVDPTELLLAEFEDSPCHHHPPDRVDGGGAVPTETTTLETTRDDDVHVEEEQQGQKKDKKQGRQLHELEGDESPPDNGDKRRWLLLEEEEEQEGQKKKKKEKGEEEVLLSAVTTEEDDSASPAAAPAGSTSSDTKQSSSAEGQSNKTKQSNNKSHGSKRKVDWTPELHRKFVQAVEQLGIDKAVPSRILEIMGIQGLTRHNIASHLQKYRSHRKHLMAREAEAATWAQKRQMYAATAAAQAQLMRTKRDMPAAGPPPWVVPTIVGFPPPGPFGRPLHVWGHPPTALEAAAPMLPVWPRHLAPPRPWGPAPVNPAAAAYWHQQCNNAAAGKWDPHAVTPWVPPPHFPAPVPGTMTPPMYRPQTSKLLSVASSLLPQLPQLDAHPSKESIDAAIGDVLVKPWLPLPLGLKPPSLDSVMSELHKHGIPNIPPPPPPPAG